MLAGSGASMMWEEGLRRKTMYKYSAKCIVFGFWIGLLAALSIALGCTSDRDAAPDARTVRVVSNLLVESSLVGKFATATLTDRMTYYHTPGVSIAVINNYQIEWANGFGVREAGSTAPVSEETLFQAGSISKPIFALAVMRLAQNGTLSLDEDVSAYLSSWKVPPSENWQPVVTLRQLLSHTACLTVHGFPGYLRSESIPSVVQVLDGESPANTPPVRVNCLPGTRFRYSGGGTTVAQQVVMDVLQQPFPNIMQTLVLEPLAMRTSTYEQPLPETLHVLAATAHPWKGKPVAGRWHVYPEMAAAGLWATPSDLARVGIELQRALNGEEDRLLSPTAVAQMLTAQPGTEGKVGIGFFLEGTADSARFGHDGWDEGFVADMTFYRGEGRGAVVMINSTEGAEIIPEIMRAIAKEYGWPDYVTEPPQAVPVIAASLRTPVGRYTSEAGHEFHVTEGKGVLWLKSGNQNPVQLKATSPRIFFAPALNVTVSFERDKRGKITGLILEQDDSKISAKKEQ